MNFDAGYRVVLKTAGLEKVALNKITLVALQNLEQTFPGIADLWRASKGMRTMRDVATALGEGQGMSSRSISRAIEDALPEVPSYREGLVRQTTPQLQWRTPQEIRGERILTNTFPLHEASQDPSYLSPLQMETKRLFAEQRWSGAHRPRQGEQFIPSSIDADFVHDPSRGEGDVWFRGNPTDVDGAAFVTRHPDVAAAYAAGEVGMEGKTPPTGRLFAFPRNAADAILPETVSDWWGGAFGDPSGQIRRSERARELRTADPFGSRFSEEVDPRKQLAASFSRRVPTYEAIADPTTLQNPVSEWEVRRARQGGQIGYAASPVGETP